MSSLREFALAVVAHLERSGESNLLSVGRAKIASLSLNVSEYVIARARTPSSVEFRLVGGVGYFPMWSVFASAPYARQVRDHLMFEFGRMPSAKSVPRVLDEPVLHVVDGHLVVGIRPSSASGTDLPIGLAAFCAEFVVVCCRRLRLGIPSTSEDAGEGFLRVVTPDARCPQCARSLSPGAIACPSCAWQLETGKFRSETRYPDGMDDT